MNVFHRRAFSQTILELGPKLNTANINPNNSAIYSLVKLKDVAEALNAPEGTVACAPISGPSQFDQAIARIERLEEDQRLLAFSQNSLAISHKEQLIKNQSLEESNKKLELSQHALQVSNSRLSDTVCTLNKNVEALQLIPSILQICETVKLHQRYLIKKYLNVVYTVLPEHLQTFKYLFRLSGKNDQINEFFGISLVKDLNLIVNDQRYNDIKDYRDDVAHEPIEDTKRFNQKWDEVSSYFDKISGSKSLKYEKKFIQSLKSVNIDVKNLKDKDSAHLNP